MSRTVTEEAFDIELDDGRVAHCREAIAQPYQNCRFSAGVVSGIEPDTVYLKLKRDGREPSYFFFRPDELMAVIWCASGALWSHEMNRIGEEK